MGPGGTRRDHDGPTKLNKGNTTQVSNTCTDTHGHEFPHMQSPRPHQITGYGGDGGRRNSSIFSTGCWGLCGRRVEGVLLLLLVQGVLRGCTASLLEPSPFLK